MKLLKTTPTAVLLIAVVLCSDAVASGTLLPNNRNIVSPPGRQIFSVESQHVAAVIDNQVASTVIEQVFRNNTDRILEATYLFPIPDNVSISSFSMWMNGKEVKGQVVDANRARQVYESIVRRTRDPGLLEHVGQNLFQARVYPVPARGEVRIKIAYDEVLKYDAGVIGYRYPLKADQFGFGNIGEVSVAVNVRSVVPIKSLYSPSHEIDSKIDGFEATCGFEECDVVPDVDFQVYYTVSESDVGVNLLANRVDDGDGYFMLFLAPGKMDDSNKIIAKDIVFVIDRSGSMKGLKIEQAKNALKYCIERLHEDDRFAVITFATDVERFREGLTAASRKNKKAAAKFVDAIEARGGTDINDALLEGLDIPSSTRPRMIVFLTDGCPTVGVTNASELLANLRSHNTRKARIFTFGTGYDVNTYLLDRITEAHRGIVEYVRPEESIETKVSSFYDKVRSPVMTNLRLSFGDIEVRDVYPRVLPDLFEGSQLLVLGRYADFGLNVVQLTGRVADGEREFAYDAEFAAHQPDNGFIPRLWAARKIAYLQSEIKLNGQSTELVDEIKLLSREHGIVTPYTSYLVLEEGMRERYDVSIDLAGSRSRLEAIPVDDALESVALKPGIVTTGDKMYARGGRSGETKSQIDGAPVDDAAGSDSKSEFDRSDHISKSKRKTVVDPASERFKRVGDKTFFKTSDGWVDLAYEEGADVTEIEYLSEEYFAILDRLPEVKGYLALGEQVTFVYQNRAYRIVKKKDGSP